MGIGVLGLGSGVWGLGFGVGVLGVGGWCLEFRGQGSRLRFWGSGFTAARSAASHTPLMWHSTLPSVSVRELVKFLVVNLVIQGS